MSVSPNQIPDIHAINLRTQEAIVITQATREQFLPFQEGGSEAKASVIGSLGPLAVAKFIERQEHIEAYLRYWQACFDAGLPVVQDIFHTEENTILVPDLEADGSKLYGKGYHQMLVAPKAHPTKRPKPEMDKIFLATVSDDYLQRLETALVDHATTATEANIWLPNDETFELRLKPDGAYSLVLLDLRWASIEGRPPSFHYNRNRARDLIEHLKAIREKLKNQGTDHTLLVA